MAQLAGLPGGFRAAAVPLNVVSAPSNAERNDMTLYRWSSRCAVIMVDVALAADRP
jgi:hypothetical protein